MYKPTDNNNNMYTTPYIMKRMYILNAFDSFENNFAILVDKDKIVRSLIRIEVDDDLEVSPIITIVIYKIKMSDIFKKKFGIYDKFGHVHIRNVMYDIYIKTEFYDNFLNLLSACLQVADDLFEIKSESYIIQSSELLRTLININDDETHTIDQLILFIRYLNDTSINVNKTKLVQIPLVWTHSTNDNTHIIHEKY